MSYHGISTTVSISTHDMKYTYILIWFLFKTIQYITVEHVQDSLKLQPQFHQGNLIILLVRWVELGWIKRLQTLKCRKGYHWAAESPSNKDIMTWTHFPHYCPFVRGIFWALIQYKYIILTVEGDKRSSYLHNGISYAGKMSSFYWIRPLVTPSNWTCNA